MKTKQEDDEVNLERGRNLEKIRIKKGFSREKIEELTEIKNLYQKERGIRPLTKHNIKILSEKLGCLESDIIGNTEFYKNLDVTFKTINKIDLKQLKDIDIEQINNSRNAIESYVLDENYLNNTVGSESIFMLKCKNNLMYPLIQFDDDIYIDLNCKKFINNGIFLIKENGNGFVIKRAFKKEFHKDKIILAYDNISQGFQTLEINEEAFLKNVVGAFIYYGRKYQLL